MTAFLWRLQKRKGFQALWLAPPSCHHLLHAAPDSERMKSSSALSKAVNELWLEWLMAVLQVFQAKMLARPGSTRLESHRPGHRAFDVQHHSFGAPHLAHDDGDQRGGQSSLPRRSGLVKQPVWPAVEGFAEHSTEAQKLSQVMRHFHPKRTSSSSASSRPRPAPTQQTAKPAPTIPEPRPLEGQQDRWRWDATPSRSTKDPGPRLPWILRLRYPPDQPGRKRRGPSLTTVLPPRKQSLMCLSPPRVTLGAEESVFLIPHRPTIVPRCLTAVIADKIKHTFSKREQKSFSAFHKRPALMQPVCTASTQNWWICWKKEP